MDIIREENKNNNSVEKKDNYTPQEIFNILNDYVIGQLRAKKFYLLQLQPL